MRPKLPNLGIVPLEALLVHEQHDGQRTPPLIRRIRASGVFRHPPIVTPTQDATRHYIVLDGANRTAALNAIGCPHILVQIAKPDDPGLGLRTWNHVILEMDVEKLLSALRFIPGLDLVSSDQENIHLPINREIGLGLVQTADGRVYGLSARATSLEKRISILNAIVESYKHSCRLDRTSFSRIEQLIHLFSNLCALVIFPKLNIQDLLNLASAGCLLPAGITRTTISPRALHINLPLDVLTSGQTLAQKNAVLQKLLQERSNRGSVRYNPEAVFMFDE